MRVVYDVVAVTVVVVVVGNGSVGDSGGGDAASVKTFNLFIWERLNRLS